MPLETVILPLPPNPSLVVNTVTLPLAKAATNVATFRVDPAAVGVKGELPVMLASTVVILISAGSINQVPARPLARRYHGKITE